MEFGPITFLEPLALFGLLILPIIWWVLRITPPRPRQQIFPPLRLLHDVKKEEETPQSTPPWLLLFRLLLGAILAIALAKPILFKPNVDSNKPAVLIIDNSWAAAGNWGAILSESEAQIQHALSNNLKTAIYTSVDPSGKNTIGFVPAVQALKRIKTLRPLPFAPNRVQLAKTLKKQDLSGADIFWLSDGLRYGPDNSLTRVLKSGKIYLPASENSPLIAGKTEETANGFRSFWHRPYTDNLRAFNAVAYGPSGQVLARADIRFAAGEKTAEADFDMPSELRSQVSQIKAEGHNSAGAITLLDDSWGRPLIGLLKGSDENIQPLLSEWLYIEKALAPNADIYQGDLDQLLAVSPAIIIMTDTARTESPALKTYVEEGGLLIRFAGPKLAKRTDALLPVAIRAGGRDLDGALAWEGPQGFAPFAQESPFFGLKLNEEITVTKQLMARPGAETDAHTWARLVDGSPVITSAPLGRGRIVLFHVTAGPDWSSLPLSGLYVQMLKRILPLARASVSKQTKTGGDWSAERTLNGFGQLGSPPSGIATIADADFASTVSSTNNPPGLYRQGMRRAALNVVKEPSLYTKLDAKGMKGMNVARYGTQKPKSLSGFLLGLAALLFSLDVLMSLLASGRLKHTFTGAQNAAILIIALSLVSINSSDARAQEHGKKLDALDLYLAYVITGNTKIDKMSKAGLEGLAAELTRRTTIEPKGARGIDIENDELSYYPFLYWPVQRNEKPLSEKANINLNRYMATGGTIVFDTQDADRRKLLGNKTHPGLAVLSKSLDIPRLAPPSKDHVITKSFYLIQVYAGRWADGKIWVEADQRGSARDGVSAVIVGSNDWAAAWAKDKKGRTLAVIEQDIPRQREFAFRFGVNLAMYVLSGNYKADQVHAAILIRRLSGTPDARQNKAPDQNPKEEP
ncbi:MAG: DUF4159 domain-containing protein [Robiginitomaculum sp.]